MKSRNHFPLYQVAFGIMLMAVFFGWLVVLLEVVQRDAEILEARVREVEENNLRYISERFEAGFLRGSPISEDMVSAGAKTNRFAGVWRDEFLEYRDPSKSGSQYSAWQEGYEPFTSDDLLKNKSFLSWGDSENGRDRLASRVLKIARDEGEGFRALELLREGVWNYSGTYQVIGDQKYEIGQGIMSPGFRLLLIKELEKHEPSPELARLKLAEQIRAVEGRVEELPEEFEAITVVDGAVTFFYQRDQVAKLFESDDVMVSKSPPEGRASLHIPHLKKWSYLSFKQGHRQKPLAAGWSKNAVYFIGFCTLLSTIGLIWGAIWMGRRQLQQARARTDLAASVAHELRTPLAGQRVVLESMLKREKFDEDYLKMALRENERLGDLSEEFLTFSRLERGVLAMQMESFDLTEFLKSVVDDFSAQHEDCLLYTSPSPRDRG